MSADLIVLVPDADIEWTINTLLAKRHQALRIRPISFKIIRHPMRDNGVFNNPLPFLAPYLPQTEQALVILDREGSGQEGQKSATEMETELAEKLQQCWTAARICAIVLDPELEVWVWSPSPHMAAVLGVSPEVLQQIKAGFPLIDNGKPQRPKEAMLAVLQQSKRPFSARIFQELAERVSLNSNERAFDKLRATLQQWFPLEY